MVEREKLIKEFVELLDNIDKQSDRLFEIWVLLNKGDQQFDYVSNPNDAKQLDIITSKIVLLDKKWYQEK